MYPEYTVRLAERTGKEIYPFQISGGDRLVDPEVYTEFTRTLIHVFRNMVDHGIEMPAERASIGKERRGTIRCRLSDDAQQIRLQLSNDGKEMELDSIREQAVSRGICTWEDLDAMTGEQQLLLIFREGFTTRQAISGLSGRGIGLAAVRKALERLDGTVRVESGGGSGTTFTFKIPIRDRLDSTSTGKERLQ
jgi:two-component system chemotaxis sensor kinase CheA